MNEETASTVAVVLETASLVFRQPVSGEDSFSALGINSLYVIEYCRRLEERLGVEVDLLELFAAENLARFGAELAARIDARGTE